MNEQRFDKRTQHEEARRQEAGPIGAACAALEAATGEDRDGWSGAARSALLLELLAFRDRLDTEILKVAGEWDRAAAWAEDGALNPASWLAHQARITRRNAEELLRTARLVRDHERTAKALSAGDISPAHVEILARAARERDELFSEHEDGLVDGATTLAPEQFRNVARRWRVIADDYRASREPPGGRDGQRLHLVTTFYGKGVLNGELSPESTAILKAALDAHDSGPDSTGAAEPARSLAERRADALIAMASGALPLRSVNLDVLIDAETLEGHMAADLTAARSDLRGIGPIAPETIRRFACDSAVGRIIMRGKSEILDLGRRVRVPTPAQRRALVARDGGCAVHGCDAPADWCDAHHETHWIHGGGTDIDNLHLLCKRHHVACHEGGGTLERDEHGRVRVRPPPPPPPPPPAPW
jgi:hypothetical protein